jgi:hypothetical protein
MTPIEEVPGRKIVHHIKLPFLPLPLPPLRTPPQRLKPQTAATGQSVPAHLGVVSSEQNRLGLLASFSNMWMTRKLFLLIGS